LKRFISSTIVVLVICLIAAAIGGCKAPANPDPSENSPEPTATPTMSPTESPEPEPTEEPVTEWDNSIPALMVKVNEGHWRYLDLTEYLGQDNVWVAVPVPLSDLEAGINNIVVHSNALNGGNRNSTSLDLWFTMQDIGFDSFLSTDYMLRWDGYTDRRANIRLELKHGDEWVAYPQGEDYKTEESTVIGLYKPTGGYFNMSRNVTVDELGSFTEARVLVNLHVGSNLLEPIEEEVPEEPDPRDATTPFFKVKVNKGKWIRYDLTPEKGKHNVWITVPIDVKDLIDGDNDIKIDTNVISIGHLTDKSVNLYFTFTDTPGNTKLSTDGMVTWVDYIDRYANIKLEVKDSGGWKTLPTEEKEYRMDESTIVGLFRGDWESFYNMRKYIKVDSVDQITEARLLIHLHVGSELTLQGAE